MIAYTHAMLQALSFESVRRVLVFYDVCNFPRVELYDEGPGDEGGDDVE